MGNLVQYSVNLAIETTIILFLVLLFFICTWQKSFFETKKPFRYLLSIIILLFLNQIVVWILLINNVPVKYGAMPMRIVYFLDYIFWYGFSIAFYYYVEDLVKAGYRNIRVVYNPPKNIYKIMTIWGMISSLGYGWGLLEPSVYHLENGVAIYSLLNYALMRLGIMFAWICAIVLIIRHRKVIGIHDSILCITFALLGHTFSVVDELSGLCISYILTSLFIFILYVRIDLHKGLLFERQEKEIVMWKTQIMLSQIQPHFLYNVLTTISGMCEIQNAIQARDVVNRFADYLRTNLDSMENDKMISFEKELEHTKTYLWLEKVRFEDKLNICYEIETTDFALPSLTVQPMVENAVKHGILPKDGGGTIKIKTYEDQRNYIIVVEDDGVGVDENKSQNRNLVGIENVKKRLEILCNGTCKVQSEIGKGTIVTITLPKGERL